jgi:hypothetical protein
VAVQPYELADFVTQECQRTIQTMIELKQWHLHVIHLGGEARRRCQGLIIAMLFNRRTAWLLRCLGM